MKIDGSKSFLDTIYMVASFVIICVVVQIFYSAIVAPRVTTYYDMKERDDFEQGAPVPVWVILKDNEQKAIFILGAYAAALIVWRRLSANQDMKLLKTNLLGVDSRDLLHREKIGDWMDKLQDNAGAFANRLLPQALRDGMERFRTNGSIEEVGNVVSDHCDTDLMKRESELAWINYLAWAIPSVGFIGTVRGIGVALSKASLVQEQGTDVVTDPLGVAFNSTLVALLISIPLMLMIHWIKRTEERLVIQTEEYCRKNMVSKLYQPQD